MRASEADAVMLPGPLFPGGSSWPAAVEVDLERVPWRKVCFPAARIKPLSSGELCRVLPLCIILVVVGTMGVDTGG